MKPIRTISREALKVAMDNGNTINVALDDAMRLIRASNQVDTSAIVHNALKDALGRIQKSNQQEARISSTGFGGHSLPVPSEECYTRQEVLITKKVNMYTVLGPNVVPNSNSAFMALSLQHPVLMESCMLKSIKVERGIVEAVFGRLEGPEEIYNRLVSQGYSALHVNAELQKRFGTYVVAVRC